MSDGRHLPDGPIQHRERLEVGHEPSVQIVGRQNGAGDAIGREVGAGRSIGDDVVQVGELGERIDHLIAVGPLPTTICVLMLALVVLMNVSSGFPV